MIRALGCSFVRWVCALLVVASANTAQGGPRPEPVLDQGLQGAGSGADTAEGRPRSATNPYPDDGLYVERHLTTELTRALADAPIAGQMVAIGPLPNTEHSELVERSFLRAVLAADARVCSARGSGCKQARYGVLHLRLDCARDGFPFLWKGDLRRRLRADLILEVTDPDDEVLWVRVLSLDTSESIPARNAKGLEAPDVIPRHQIERPHFLFEGLALTAVLASFLLLAL